MLLDRMGIPSHPENEKDNSFSGYLGQLPSLGVSSAGKYNGLVRMFLRGKPELSFIEASSFIKKHPGNASRAALLHYARFLGNKEFEIDITKIRASTKPKKEPRNIPSTDEMKAFVEELEEHDSCVGLMARFMMTVGCRVSEALNVEPKDFRQDGMVVIAGKGGKYRIVPLPPTVMSRMSAYIRDNGILDTWKVFFHSSGASAESRRKMFWREITTIPKNAERGRHHTHDFRRFFATKYYEKTKDIQSLQKILGHSKIDTTSLYTQYADMTEPFKKMKMLGEELAKPRSRPAEAQASASPVT